MSNVGGEFNGCPMLTQEDVHIEYVITSAISSLKLPNFMKLLEAAIVHGITLKNIVKKLYSFFRALSTSFARNLG